VTKLPAPGEPAPTHLKPPPLEAPENGPQRAQSRANLPLFFFWGRGGVREVMRENRHGEALAHGGRVLSGEAHPGGSCRTQEPRLPRGKAGSQGGHSAERVGGCSRVRACN